jgi:hypothetical protein
VSVTLRELERLKRRRRTLAVLSIACAITGALCLGLAASRGGLELVVAGVVGLLAAVYALVVVVESGR